MKKDGCGYEWDAMMLGGPADGCLDRVISININNPPKYVFRLVDGNEMSRETLGEKLMMHLTKNQMDCSQRVAVYALKEHFGDEACLYHYLESTNMGRFREKYDNLPNDPP